MSAPRGVEIIDHAFSCGPALIDHLNAMDRWTPSQVGTEGKSQGVRTSSTCFLPFNSYSNPPVVEQFGRTLWQIIENYAMLYGIRYDMVEPLSFNRYEPGQHFAAHPDYFKGSDRVFSAVAYLNTVTEGGKTRFVYFNHEVDAVEGRVVVFPSNYLFTHEGSAPVSTTKYSAAIWVRG